MPEPHRLNETAVAIGEMREFMAHTRRTMDLSQETLAHLTEQQRIHAMEQKAIGEKLESTRSDVCEIKDSMQQLIIDKHTQKASRKARVGGAVAVVTGVGVVLALLSEDTMALIASIKSFLSVAI